METVKITFEVPAEMTVGIYDKPKGDESRKAVPMVHRLAEWDDTALAELLRKGVGRLLNDWRSGDDPATKVKVIGETLDRLNAGVDWYQATGLAPRSAGGKSKLNPVDVEAIKLAMEQIKTACGAKTYKELADHAKGAKYITTKGDVFTPNVETVLELVHGDTGTGKAILAAAKRIVKDRDGVESALDDI